MSSRASAPAVGVALLLVVAVGLSAIVGAAAFDAADSVGDPPPSASLSLSIEDGTLVFEHGGGEALDVRELRLRVRVDGDALAHQPPVPFFSARGFVPGPTGPFNGAADPRWTAGERASLEPAGTNSPAIDPGDRVTVGVYAGDARLVRLAAVG
ncbi:type IV pilin N-terminal domain-containing protein [Halorarum salinum]|uniref:Type IV pilin N-terminal domain-containing protein n=1 Tax=Halorarum salinum TaxID=2743089 RepID=A0A7D5QMJ7_9EURY|nr:type IV pilin N-terminal domain-containing protein [Halobaculum salinum]QLG63545.1 type IV pilin N-terminal domain-containing protein [Halobaculum salinum]